MTLSESSTEPEVRDDNVEEDTAAAPPAVPPVPRSDGQLQLEDAAFHWGMVILGGTYVLLIVSMLGADILFTVHRTFVGAESMGDVLFDNPMVNALRDKKIQHSIWLSLISCSVSAIISIVVAIPMGYLLSRRQFPGRRLVDAILDIPIVLPPLVIGLSLLILFQYPPFSSATPWVVYKVPAVILAQFSVACAFAVRTMKATFDHIDPRCEQVAWTLGCNRFQAFGIIVMPEAMRGITTAFTLAWARSLGEFGPLLIFAGATRMKTEVLSTSVFLEMNVGNIEAAVAVSMIMVVAAVLVLIVARLLGDRQIGI